MHIDITSPDGMVWIHFQHNQLTSGNRVFLETLTVFRLAQKFLAYYGNLEPITVIIRARYWTVSWANLIQSTPRTTHIFKIHSKIFLLLLTYMQYFKQPLLHIKVSAAAICPAQLTLT